MALPPSVCDHTVHRHHYRSDSCGKPARWIIEAPHLENPVKSCQQHLATQVSALTEQHRKTTPDPRFTVRQNPLY